MLVWERRKVWKGKGEDDDERKREWRPEMTGARKCE
jgi:hypothetical protein